MAEKTKVKVEETRKLSTTEKGDATPADESEDEGTTPGPDETGTYQGQEHE